MVEKVNVKNAEEVWEWKDKLAQELMELLQARIERPFEKELQPKIDAVKAAYDHATDVERRLSEAEREKRVGKQFSATLAAAIAGAFFTAVYAVTYWLRGCP